jgi:flagellar biosynthetic protein FliQ
MSSILLLIISIAAPWVVQLAPPRQRPVALVAVIAVLLLFGIFSGNPISMWQFWIGLIIGIFQAATSINEATLTFVPKLLVIVGVLALSAPSQILFGSDYPYVQMEKTVGGLDRLGYGPDLLGAINRESALKLFPRFA